MEAAIFAAPSNHGFLHFKSGDKYMLHKQSTKRITVMTMTPPRLRLDMDKGAGARVLEKPLIEKTTVGGESDFDLRRTLSRYDVNEGPPSWALYRKLGSYRKYWMGVNRWKSRKMVPMYRVMLHNDNYNEREFVMYVLLKVIPGMTVDDAVKIMRKARIKGLSVVIVCAYADAEAHCTQLSRHGLLSSIEPDGFMSVMKKNK